MSFIERRRRRSAAVAFAAVAELAAAASCGDSDSSGGTDEKVTLSVGVFGEFGYEKLYEEYKRTHRNIEIVQRKADFNPHHEQLTQRLAAGSGASDIEAVEEGFIVSFRAQSQNFVNLLDHGADALRNNWLEWKYKQALSGDGKTLIGLGTDVGSMAMCYRRDLFQTAGLPVDREAVSKLWPTWEAYIDTGRRFAASPAGTKAKFVDAATNTYNTILMQQGDTTYFDTSDKLVMDNAASVRKAWDLTMTMIQSNLSANLEAFQAPWNAAFKSGAFATIACPAWMLGYIKTQAPDATGKWDVASVPGGAGNWGGSFLTVPRSGKHIKEAVELAKFLTSPQSQLAVFKEKNNLPSVPKLYDDPALVDFKDPYFNNAPVGKIFSEPARSLKPVYLGPKNGPVRSAVENTIRAVEQRKLTAAQAWTRALADAERAAR